METSTGTIEMYTLDIAELDNFISISTRPNIKRQLEEYKKNLVIQLENEKKKLEKEKLEKENNQTSKQTESKKEYVPITKYALDSGDKFVK
jgi:hypothetical protein